jgi:aryl-alcohol dehydrogenase-like predicted oxidoreductase
LVDLPELTSVGLDIWSSPEVGPVEESDLHELFELFSQNDINIIDLTVLGTRQDFLNRVGKLIERKGLREEMFLSFKFYPGTIDVEPSRFLEETLRALKINRLDLLSVIDDDRTSSNQNFPLLEKALDRDLTRYIGLFTETSSLGKTFETVDTLQIPFSIVDSLWTNKKPSASMQTLALDPLYSGLFTEDYCNVDEEVLDEEVQKYHPKFTSDRTNYLRTLKSIADRIDKSNQDISLPVLAVTWLLERANVDTVLVKPSTLKALEEAKYFSVGGVPRESLDILEQELSDLVETSGPPKFTLPPPFLPRHSYERHILN